MRILYTLLLIEIVLNSFSVVSIAKQSQSNNVINKSKDSCLTLGGEVFLTKDIWICRIKANECPPGWKKHANFSKTSPQTCIGEECASGTCTTSYHEFSDKPYETCLYSTGGNTCKSSCCGSATHTCTAKVIEVGCQ